MVVWGYVYKQIKNQIIKNIWIIYYTHDFITLKIKQIFMQI